MSKESKCGHENKKIRIDIETHEQSLVCEDCGKIIQKV